MLAGEWSRVGTRLFVREKLAAPPAITAAKPLRSSVVIVGGGAAGLAAADMLRREGYSARIIIVSADDSAPYDRPNLSKDFLTGNAPAEWMPLREPSYYSARHIDLALESPAAAIDIEKRRVHLASGRQLEFGALLLATGADPVRLDIPGSGDMQAAITCAALPMPGPSSVPLHPQNKSSWWVRASSGLRWPLPCDSAASKSTSSAGARSPRTHLGTQVGKFVREVHESHGATFHLGASVARMDGKRVTLGDGSSVEADCVVLGVGVRPAIALAEHAGLAIDRGIRVNEYLETSAAGVFAAGDVARWPDPHTGEHIRVEHWVVAERQGQVAALNILGRKQRFDAVPFFWSQHYDVVINYVGHAESWDSIDIDGSLTARDCAVTFRRGGRILAVATIARDLQNLKAERDLELQASMTCG